MAVYYVAMNMYLRYYKYVSTLLLRVLIPCNGVKAVNKGKEA